MGMKTWVFNLIMGFLSSITTIPPASFDSIHHDTFIEILLRLPKEEESLVKLRLVSKSWCNAIGNPSLAHRLSTPGIILYDRSSASLCYAKDDGEAKVIKLEGFRECYMENSCNGLLCFSKSSNGFEQVFICNPILKESIALPVLHSTTNFTRYRRKSILGFSPSTQEYKVVQFSVDLVSLIYTLGTKSWRHISSVPPHSLFGETTYANGALHWKVDPVCPDKEESAAAAGDRIVSFDIEKEVFYVTKHPNLGKKLHYWMIDLFNLKGCLALVDHSFYTHIDIWVLKENKDNMMKKQWFKEHILKINPPINLNFLDATTSEQQDNNSVYKIIGLWQQGEILFTFFHMFYSYDLKTNDMKYIDINLNAPSSFTTINRFCAYTTSLMSLKPYGGGYKKQGSKKR